MRYFRSWSLLLLFLSPRLALSQGPFYEAKINGTRVVVPIYPLAQARLFGSTPNGSVCIDANGYLVAGTCAVTPLGLTAQGITTALTYTPLPLQAVNSLPLQIATQNNIIANTSKFTDGTPYFRAAPGYTVAYISDTSLAMLGYPQFFQASAVGGVIDKFVGAASTTALEPTIPAGSIPIALTQSGSPAIDPSSPLGNTRGYCAGFDAWCHHPTAEAIFSLVHIEQLYYLKTNDLTRWNRDSNLVDAAMTAIPVDSATKIPVINPGDEWTCFGFQESIRFTGLVATCAVQMWKVETEVAALYGAAGNTVQQAKYTALAAQIAAHLGTSSPLWDATDGMFLGATIQDNQIDTTASVLFCQYQVPTPNLTAQCNAISSYLVANASTLFLNGYMRQGAVDFATVGSLTSAGPPYNTSDYRNGTGCYQRGGFWSHVNRAVIETLNITSATAASAYLAAFEGNVDPTMEVYSPTCAGATSGFTQNLESPVGAAYAALEFPGLVTQPLGGTSLPDFSIVSGVRTITSSGANETLDIYNSNSGGPAAINFVDFSRSFTGASFGWGNASMSLSFLRGYFYFVGLNKPLCFATSTTRGCDATMDTSGTLHLSGIAATSGKRYACIDTTGAISSSSTPCSGT